MADEEKDEEVAEPKKKSPVILIAVLVLVGLILAGGISFFVTTQMMAQNANGGDAGGEVRHSDPGLFIQIGDPKEGILVNVGGPKAGKYLKTTIILEMNPGKETLLVEGKMTPETETKVMDTVLQLIRSAKLEEFDALKQDELKKKIKDELNTKLGPGSIYDVYITSFLLQ